MNIILELPNSKKDLEHYIELQIQENLHLDYKRSKALTKKNRDEIIKDVTSFANSDGGIIIYGIEEKEQLPFKLDEGTENTETSREWLENILSSHITPYLDGITIRQIPFNDERSFYAIKIPKSFRGPHQANDKKYYKRYNFKSCPMEHYEILDVLNRKGYLALVINASLININHHFYLTIENISDYIVQDIKFLFPDNFKWPSSGFPKALNLGINNFPANKKFYYHFCIDSPSTIQIDEFPLNIRYIHPESFEEVNETFYINLKDYQEGKMPELKDDGIKNEIRKVNGLLEHYLISTGFNSSPLGA